MSDGQPAETWREEAALLRAEINRVDDWANGVFAALLDVLPPLLKSHPEMASLLGDKWGMVAKRYDVLAKDPTQREHENETPEALEARKMLYQVLGKLGAWSGHPRH